MKKASFRRLWTTLPRFTSFRACHVVLVLVALLILAVVSANPRRVIAGIWRPASVRLGVVHGRRAFRSVTESGTARVSGAPDFNRDIEPILRANCYKCHTGDDTQARLRLDSEAAILAGGVSGPSISPGHSQGSLLVKRILGLTEAPRMPLGGDPLPAEKIALIRAWIDRGDFSHTQDRAGFRRSQRPASFHIRITPVRRKNPAHSRESLLWVPRPCCPAKWSPSRYARGYPEGQRQWPGGDPR